MPSNPHPLNSYRLTVDGTALSFNYGWKRDQSWQLTFFDHVEDQAKDLDTAAIPYQIVNYPGGTTLETGTLSVTDATNGLATLALTAADLASLTWELGQSMQVVYLHIQVTLSGSQQVSDDRGNLYFPIYVTWEPA